MRSVRGRKKIEELCADILQDESNVPGAWCEMAGWPETPEEAEDFMGEAAESGLQLTVSGGLTGVAGGALPRGGAVLSASLMKGMEMLENGNVRVGGGVTLEELREFLAVHAPGHFYPPDPTEETASAGGTIATDASGGGSFLYGSTRRWVESASVVLPGGKTVVLRRGGHRFSDRVCTHPLIGRMELPALRSEQPAKNAAGYHIRPDMDLLDLFIGSEGTLGVVALAELKLAPRPRYLMDLAVFPESSSSFWDLYRSLLYPGPTLRLRALEMMDRRCVSFLRDHPGELPPPPGKAEFVLLLTAEAGGEDELEETLVSLDDLLVKCGIDPDTAWGGFEPAERRRMKELRHSLPESVNNRISRLRNEFPEIHKFGSDGAVEPRRLKEYYDRCVDILERKQLPFLIFGHAGQGHLHANALPESPGALAAAEEAMREIAAAAVEMDGTISAEHGLGRLKQSYLPLMYSPEEIRGMNRVRKTIDPEGVLAPAIRF
ncbi:MAG: FAD-binding oxidoreductase [Candidatus Aegiribacteria sp.]